MIPDATFTLDKAKAHLRITHADEDALITTMLDGAVALCERFTRRAWTLREWTQEIAACAAVDDAVFHAELSPLKAGTLTVFAIDGAGNEVELPATDYFVTASFGHSVVVMRQWSAPLAPEGIAGRIEYTAEPFGVPADVYAAVMLYLGDLYENRESQMVGTIAVENRVADMLLRPYVLDLHI